MTALGLHNRQTFIITSKVVSREMNEAKVYCASAQRQWQSDTFETPVETPMALGMTNAVIFFSMVLMSVKGTTTLVTQPKMLA